MTPTRDGISLCLLSMRNTHKSNLLEHSLIKFIYPSPLGLVPCDSYLSQCIPNEVHSLPESASIATHFCDKVAG